MSTAAQQEPFPESIQSDTIHSKSEDPDPNYPAKEFEFSANLSKNATKWPKKWPKMTQNGPNMTPNDPKWLKMAQK